MKRAFAAAVLAGCVATLGSATGASACSCVQLSPGLVKSADARVVTRLDAIQPLPQQPGPIVGPGEADYTYTVLEALGRKRPLPAGTTVTIRTSGGSAACGLAGSVGSVYGMLLDRSATGWSGSSCGTTSPAKLRRLVKLGKRSSKR